MTAPSPERCATLLRESVNALFALVCVGLFITTLGLWAVIIAEKVQ